MELDFSKIIEEIAQNKPVNESPKVFIPKTSKKPAQAKITQFLKTKPKEEQAETLAKKYRTERQAQEADYTIYRQVQKNIKTAERLRAELLIDIKQGKSQHSLFLKAVRIISLMTDDKAFYSQVEADTASIYGVGLQEPETLQNELDGILARLEKLEIARNKEKEAGEKARIAAAIAAHEKRAGELFDILEAQEKQNTEQQEDQL